MSSFKKALPVLVLFVLFSSSGWAQIVPPGGSPNAGAPQDGFTSLLLAAGIGYGIKRIRNREN